MPEYIERTQPLPPGSRILNTIPAPQPQYRSPIQTQQPQQQQERPERDVLKFFETPPPMPGYAGRISADDPAYEGYRQGWFQNFADQFHTQNFNTLDDYITFAENITDTEGLPLAVEGIRPYVQKQVMEYMPSHLKQELQEREAIKKARQNFKQQVQMQMEAQNALDETYGKGTMSWNAKNASVAPTSKDLDFERKMGIVDKFDSRLKSHEECEPRRIAEKGKPDPDYDRQHARWEKLKAFYEDQYFTASEQLMNKDAEREGRRAPSGVEQSEQQQVLRAVQSGQMTREQAVAIARQKGWQ